MSDPIADILEGFESESNYVVNEAYDNLLKASVKQIRQQIGLELKEKLPHYTYASYTGNFIHDVIDKVCQLEEK